MYARQVLPTYIPSLGISILIGKGSWKLPLILGQGRGFTLGLNLIPQDLVGGLRIQRGVVWSWSKPSTSTDA